MSHNESRICVRSGIDDEVDKLREDYAGEHSPDPTEADRRTGATTCDPPRDAVLTSEPNVGGHVSQHSARHV